MSYNVVYYSTGYKYITRVIYTGNLPVTFAGVSIEHPWGSINNCTVVIKERYAWNGASGPTWDTKSSIRPSLVHDFLYQLIDEGYLPEIPFRKFADDFFKQQCLEDGMWNFRAKYWHFAVREFGDDALREEDVILKAP